MNWRLRIREKAGDFYTGLFGWGKNVQQMGPMTYTSFMNGDRPAGGMYTPPPEMGEMPPHWLVYFAVDDTDAMVAKATELGATTCCAADGHSGHRTVRDSAGSAGRGFRDHQAGESAGVVERRRTCKRTAFR